LCPHLPPSHQEHEEWTLPYPGYAKKSRVISLKGILQGVKILYHLIQSTTHATKSKVNVSLDSVNKVCYREQSYCIIFYKVCHREKNFCIILHNSSDLLLYFCTFVYMLIYIMSYTLHMTIQIMV
jgi:hypothetical protein